MNALLSIKPKHVAAITNGDKRYEFRRCIFRSKTVSRIYIYSTSPVKKVVGSFSVGTILEDSPQELWRKVSNVSGLTEEEFFAYFKNCRVGFAIEIANLEEFGEPLDPRDLMIGFVPPQSFCYLPQDALE